MADLYLTQAGRLIGIAFDKIGPILAFQVSFIESAVMEINPEAEVSFVLRTFMSS